MGGIRNGRGFCICSFDGPSEVPRSCCANAVEILVHQVPSRRSLVGAGLRREGFLLNLGFCVLDLGVQQIFWVITLELFVVAGTVVMRPWRQMAVNVIDVWCQLCLMMVSAL